jgi:hypothetical protein
VLQKSIEKTIVLWKLCYKDSQSVLELLLGAIMQQTGASVSSDWYRSGDLSSYKSLTLSASVRIPVHIARFTLPLAQSKNSRKRR